MLSNENPPPDPSSRPCEISQLNNSSTSTDYDQQSSGVLQSDLLISSPKFTLRDYAFSNRRKDIKTNWPFSEKTLQLCLNRGVKDLLPPFQSLDAVNKPSAQRCTIATSLVSKEKKYHPIDQASRLNNHLLSFTSVDAQPSLTSLHSNTSKSEGVRIFSSMVVEAETSLNCLASKPVKKRSLVVSRVENIMKPLTKKCREIVKLNNTAADQSKLENNTANFMVSKTMASKVCPVCKTFTSSSNTTLNAHIDQCLSGKSINQRASDPKLTKSRIKPKRMRSMVDIYATAQHCTVEELERRNGINLASCSSLPAKDMEAGSIERKTKSDVDFEDIENEAAVYVDGNGTKLRILSKLNDLSSLVMEGDEPGKHKYVDDEKSSELCLAKKKKKKNQEKFHKLQIRVSDGKKLCSPRHHQNSQTNIIQEHSSGPEEHLEVEAFTNPPRAHGLIKYIEPNSEVRNVFSKRSVLTKMSDSGAHLHPTWTREKKSAGVKNGESPRYSYVNGGCGSSNNSGTPPARPRSSEPHNGCGIVLSLRRSVKDPLGEGNQKELNKSDFSVKCKNKVELGNKLNPMASLNISKVKMKRGLTRNASSGGDNSKHFPDGHDLSSKSIGFSSSTQNQASRLSNPQTSTPESTFCPKSKWVDLKRPHSYCESRSDGEEIVWRTVENKSKSVTADRRELKVSRDKGTIKVSGRRETLVFKGMKSTSKHCEPQTDGINVQPFEKDVVDEVPFNNIVLEPSKELCMSSDVQCHEVSGHLDVQSDSRGYMEFCNGPSLVTEDAIYPVESILDGGEKMFYIGEDGKSIFGQNVHATTKLHSNDGSDCYYPEVDLIPIPGPPGSFLPSPSSNEFHGNSTPTSSQDQSSENPHEFADRDSSDSPSPTSTISNSDIGRFDSSLVERFPFRHSIQDVMRSSVYDITGGTMVDKISLDPSAALAGGGGGGLDHVAPKVHLLNTEKVAPLELKNDRPCSCSRKDGAVLGSAIFNIQDTSHLSYPSMPSVPEFHFNTQVSSDETRLAKKCNLMSNVKKMQFSGHPAGEMHNATGDPLEIIPNKVCTNSGVSSPSTPNPIFRLMGKDLVVLSKETTKEIIVIDDAFESSADLATHGMGAMNHRGPLLKPELMASGVSPRDSNSMYSGLLAPARTRRFQVPPIMGVNFSVPNKWNCVAQSSNSIQLGSFPSFPSSAHHTRSSTYQSGDFS